MADFNQGITAGGAPSEDPAEAVACDPPTGIDVLIVGAGVAGLVAAMECHRRGHNVRILERSERAEAGGDQFTIGLSGRRIMEHYPAMERELDRISLHNGWMGYRKWTGEEIGEMAPFAKLTAGVAGAGMDKQPMIMQLRPLYHAMLYRQIQRFNIPVSYGKRVVEYYEDLWNGKGGVRLEGGDREDADIVVAADGLHSRSKSLIIGHEQRGKPSGRSILRSAFPLDVALSDPLVKQYFGLKDDKYPVTQAWIGADTHAMVTSYVDKQGQNGQMLWGLTFTESGEQSSIESWSHTVTAADALRILEQTPGWGEPMEKLVKAMPDNSIVYWPLILRDPHATWHSKGCRVLMIGDAAHGFLPTSGNGATQAIEDAITIAACLAKAGRENIAEAVETHCLLRSERVSCGQLLGFINAQRYHKTDLSGDKVDPSTIRAKVPKWIFQHDPEKYALENYAAAAASLKSNGPKFINTNIPPGHTPAAWTIAGIEKMEKEGKMLEPDGDWS